MINNNSMQPEYEVQTITENTTGTETANKEHLHNYDYVLLDTTLLEGYYNYNSGELDESETAKSTAYTTGLINCYPGEKYRVTCSVNSNVVGIVYFDINQNLIGYNLTKLTEENTQTYNLVEFTVPYNCKYIAFQTLKTSSDIFCVEKYNDIKAIYESKTDNNLLHFYANDYVSFNLPLTTGYFNYENGKLENYKNASTTGLIKCCPGEKYSITSMSMYQMAIVVYFDSNKKVIGYDGVSTEESITKDIVIPYNCSYVAFQKHKNAQSFEIKKYNELQTLYKNMFVEYYKPFNYENFEKSARHQIDSNQLVKAPAIDASDDEKSYYKYWDTFLLECNPGDKFIVSGFIPAKYPAIGVAIFLDSNKNLISFEGQGKNDADTTIKDTEIIAPEKTKFVAFNSYHKNSTTGIELSVKKYVSEYITDKVNKIATNSYNNPLYGKKIFVDGDSVAQGDGSHGTSFADIIAIRNNMTLTKTAVGGTTLAKNDLINTKTVQGVEKNYKSICERVTELKPHINDSDKYDYILIEGGFNDVFNSLDIGSIQSRFDCETYDPVKHGSEPGSDANKFNPYTTIGAMELMCKHLITYYFDTPKLFVLGHKQTKLREDKTNFLWLNKQNQAWDGIKSALEKWGIPYIDLRYESNLMLIEGVSEKYFNNGDGSHPTREAYERFYVPAIEAKLKSL